MVKVKVCGISNLADALKSVEFGADALGFNFYPLSPRYVAPEEARKILLALPEDICKVALFVNESRARVKAVLDACRGPAGTLFTALQFHGDEDGAYCQGWDLKVIKAFRVKSRESLAAMEGFPADLYLVDSWAPGYGGSGSRFPWKWLQGLASSRLILAGGLDPGNVAAAVAEVRPYAVDVCTGVEAKPGVKEHAKIKEFIRAAKAAG
ncbi:MAG TPA: phosphoribosylanthranilate isomerase [Candidatus Acidoferrales bacterium]|nr:phosphoribosylanthranilate isomerase [Candidatus Acidoferrales bacterium]